MYVFYQSLTEMFNPLVEISLSHMDAYDGFLKSFINKKRCISQCKNCDKSFKYILFF